MSSPIWWVAFNALILTLLALDLGVFHRRGHAVGVREALTWSAIWVSLAIAFGVGIWWKLGQQPALEFFTGYLVEEALSVDNLFVFIMIFGYFRVPAELQHRVLFWGILGALVMRGAMIATGALLLERFHWVIYIFGAFLVITGIRMALSSGEAIEPEANPVLRLLRRFIPVTTRFHGEKFFVREALRPGEAVRRVATPLFVVLVLVETTDVVFALDSIPAIFGVTRDPFLVYSSNVFAILGLRSLYFVLAGVIGKFHLLKYGLSVVLSFVGVKMIIAEWYKIPIGIALGVVALVLLASVLLSLVIPPKEPPPTVSPDATANDGAAP
ncbi:MAG: TerC family protein [Gemmatimonadaceae bacterium]|jgi:tellurite resistance protein TerC|nr:TerC family protein [Gemmatimonadaceae bacterium]